MLLKSNIDQVEDHILGLSTVAVAKKIKELIKKDELTVADLEGVGLEMLRRQYKNDVEIVSCRAVECNTLRGSSISMGEKYTTSLTKHFAARYHTKDARKEFFKAEMGNRSPDKVYFDKRIICVVKVDVKRK
nr:hypothetical protein [Tanacetum cinerariifolium]